MNRFLLDLQLQFRGFPYLGNSIFCMKPADQGMSWFKAMQCVAGNLESIPVYGYIVIYHYETRNRLKHLFMILVSLWLRLWLHLPLCSVLRWYVKMKQIIGRTSISNFPSDKWPWEYMTGGHCITSACQEFQRRPFCYGNLNLTLNYDSRRCELSSCSLAGSSLHISRSFYKLPWKKWLNRNS